LRDRFIGTALLEQDLAGKTVIYSTTNGTVALSKSQEAAHVFAASLVNAEAVVDRIERTFANETVLLVCSGSADNFNLEDFYGAGHFVEHFQKHGDYELNDAARGAKLVRRGYDARTVLMGSRVGLMMQAKGLANEVEYCAQVDILDVVARLEGGALRTVNS